MNGIWQDIIVMAAAGVALAWLIRQRIRARRKGCPTCALAEIAAQGPAAARDAKDPPGKSP